MLNQICTWRAVSFNEGKIVDAKANSHSDTKTFREVIKVNSAISEFSASMTGFAVVISITSSANFLLDVLSELDNKQADKQGLRNLKDKFF